MSRICLDNFPSVQSSWVTQGPEIGQVALQYGANDLGSIMIEENVVSQAGATYRMGVADMRCLIEDRELTRGQESSPGVSVRHKTFGIFGGIALGRWKDPRGALYLFGQASLRDAHGKRVHPSSRFPEFT